MTNKRSPKIQTRIPFFVFLEGDAYVAYSPALDLSTCGDTEEEARRMFGEAARVFINELTRMGTLEDVLAECGWTRAKPAHTWSPPIYKQDFVEIA